MGKYTYNLNANQNTSTSFHLDLAATTNQILEYIYSDPSMIHIKDFQDYISKIESEPKHSLEEYMVEYLMIGLYWKKYGGFASGLSNITRTISGALYNSRKISRSLKPTINKMRGKIATKQLLKHDNSYELIPIVENFERLTIWLDTSKQFIQEHKRLIKWLAFLKQKSPIYVSSFLGSTKEASSQFIKISKANLGIYTNGLSSFLENAGKRYKNREDIILCTRSEEEYFLNMVAIEILNRAQRGEFAKTSRKIVLLPECMSSPKSGLCMASKTQGIISSCKACTTDCRVNQIRKMFEKSGMEVKLIPHTSNVSKYLKQWENHPEVGMVSVGCVLNLLSKAYEIISMKIPMQGVFLDYAGCHLHWPDINKATDLNTETLSRTLGLKRKSISNLKLVLD